MFQDIERTIFIEGSEQLRPNSVGKFSLRFEALIGLVSKMAAIRISKNFHSFCQMATYGRNGPKI